jgi:hypothetical protein
VLNARPDILAGKSGTSRRQQHQRDTVEIQSKQPSTKGPAEMFTGDVWFDVVAK